MEFYNEKKSVITPASIGDGKVCTVVKDIISCNSGTQLQGCGGGTCFNFGTCQTGSC